MRLAPEQRQTYEREGYLAPLEFCSSAEMVGLREAIGAALASRRGPQGADPWGSRHQDCRVVYEICASEAIVDAVSAFLGPNVILWNSVFFNKEPGGSEIPWHQDRMFTMMEPVVNVAVWLAIDDAHRGNGCLQLIPGSHRQSVPHTERTMAGDFNARAEVSDLDRARATHIELRAGQFILFHENILHYSPKNLSPDRRQGLAIRYTVPGVRIKTDQLFDGYFVYPVRGTDDERANAVGIAPTE
jgi:ectoine hydroxylase-related dioxygenase (phytanoyl-CoA dioxygenase family)